MVRQGTTRPAPTGRDIGCIRTAAAEALTEYLTFAGMTLGAGGSLAGLRVVLDCANGAVAQWPRGSSSNLARRSSCMQLSPMARISIPVWGALPGAGPGLVRRTVQTWASASMAMPTG